MIERPLHDRRSIPKRPYLTPLTVCALVVWASCAAAYSAGQLLEVQQARGLCVGCAPLAIASFGAIAVKRHSVAPFVLVSVLVGVLLGLGAAASVLIAAERVAQHAVAGCELVLLQDCEDSGYADRALADLTLNDGSKLRVLASFEWQSGYLCGQRLRVSGAFKKAPEASRGYYWQKGTLVVCSVKRAEEIEPLPVMGFLQGLRNEAIGGLADGTESGAVLAALICGYRGDLDNAQVYSSFQACGLAHLVAVSGAHLVTVTGFVSTLLRRVRAPRRPSIFVLMATMAAYVVFSGMPISAIRAATMSSVGILAILGMRRPSSLNALGLAIMAIVCTSPSSALSASLVLSALSTLGIVVFSPLLEHCLELALRKRIPLVTETLALTLSAMIASQLYSCSIFCILPLASPLANIVCAPLFPLCCGFGLVAAALVCAHAPFAFVAVWLARFFVSVLDGIVTLTASIPFSAMPFSIETSEALIITAVLSLAFWLIWDGLLDRRNLAASFLFSVLFAFFATLAPAGDCICMLDVGQGDAFLIQSGTATLLVDTGNRERDLLEQLARCHVAHLDGVLITHADDDHCGALRSLGQFVQVDTVIVAHDMLDCEDAACKTLMSQAHQVASQVNGVEVGDELSVGNFRAKVLWPYAFKASGENEDSVVFVLEHDADRDGNPDTSALFTGDAEIDQLDAIMKTGTLGPVDILKVGHHGSKNSLTEAQLATLNPTISLIGVGAHNRYGHPASQILDMLERANCRIFRTDLDGGMRFTLKNNSIVAQPL